MQDVLGSLFTSVVFLGFINFQMIIPTFLMERPVMNRERASRLYSVVPWVQAMEDVEIPWVILQVCRRYISTRYVCRVHRAYALCELVPQ